MADCDNCGKPNAKNAGMFRMLCVPCRELEERDDETYDEADYSRGTRLPRKGHYG